VLDSRHVREFSFIDEGTSQTFSKDYCIKISGVNSDSDREPAPLSNGQSA